MRAMVLEHNAPIEQSPLKLTELPEPVPVGKQVRIRVSCCAICRTDLHVIEAELAPHKLPIVPGHQIVGTIDRLGDGARRFKIGQRVGAAWLAHTCGQCRFCRSGQENLCERQRFTGWDIDGGFAEYALADEAFVYPIPDGFDDLHAAPLLCAGIVGYRAYKRSRLPRGGRLAIYGFGSSAHVIIQIALHQGARVMVVSREPRHQDLALRLGAAWAGPDAASMPEPADSAILFAPAGELVPVALEHLDKGGTLSLAGIHMSDIPPLNYQRHLFGERTITSTTANCRTDGQELLEQAAQVPVVAHIVQYRLEWANQALADLKHDKLTGTAVLAVR